MARREYDEQTKAAVMAALLTGQSISSIAREYKIPEGTVAAWSARTKREPLQANANTKKEIGDRLLRYLNAALETLTIQVEVFRDEAWLKKQSASEAAVLHGVLADKTIRLLEALAGSEGPEGTEAPAEPSNEQDFLR